MSHFPRQRGNNVIFASTVTEVGPFLTSQNESFITQIKQNKTKQRKTDWSINRAVWSGLRLGRQVDLGWNLDSALILSCENKWLLVKDFQEHTQS